MNSSAEIVLISKDLDRVTVRFICRKPLSHSDEKIGMVSREHLKGNSFSGIFLSTTYS
jgi:hypothetical protein